MTAWYSGLLLVFGIAFVVSLNIAARLDQPKLFTIDQTGSEWELVPVRTGPGGAVNGYRPVLTPQFSLTEAEDELYSQNLDRLQTLSLLAVVGLAVASGLGGYMLSGMLLRPVRDMTRIASEISASNLGARINHTGPEDELKALADTMDSMIARLQDAFESQRQFVQDASHELRTPLAALRTNIEVAEMDGDISPEEYRQLLDTLKSQTERLTRLSDDLLLLTTSESTTPLPEPVEIGPLAQEVVRQLGPLAATRAVVLSTEMRDDVDALGNSDLLYRCVFNLVENAIKYAGEGARVVVRTGADQGQAVLDVIDDGQGIAEHELPHLFDRFYRVDKARSRRAGGSGAGLGLAIVRELVVSMGGNVAVESAPGRGARFTIRLPLARVATPAQGFHAIARP